jgi:lipopolysaccharide export system protein LptA
MFFVFLGVLSRILYWKRKNEVMWDYPHFRIFFLILLMGMQVDSLWAYDIKDSREVSPKKPVNISAVQLIFDRLKGLTLFKGGVKAVHDNVTLTANELRALSENREASAEGQVKVVDPTAAMTLTCGNLEYQDLMNLMTAHDHPLLTSLDENGRPITARGRQMELDSEKKTVVIHQNVQIIHEDGRAEAQKATFLAKEDKFILEEDPKMFVPNGKLSGRRIVSNLGGNRSILVEGMADAAFYTAGAPPTGKNDHSPTSPPGGPHDTGAEEMNAPTATPTPGIITTPGKFLW